MTEMQCAVTPISDHVARLWGHLETETVRIVLDLKRTVGVDAADGPVIYWDGASFSDDVAKAMVADRAKDAAELSRLRKENADMLGALREIGREQSATNGTAAADKFQSIARAAILAAERST